MATISNAYHYFEMVASALDHCCHAFAPESVDLENIDGIALEWEANILFNGGRKMVVADRIRLDQYSRPVKRNFSYDLRQDDALVFRFDTHGRSVDMNAACHIHYPDPNGLERRMQFRNGQPAWLVAVNFLDVLKYATWHIEGSPQCPWVQP